MAINVVVRPGADSAFITWDAPPIEGCRGFALKRRIIRGPDSPKSPNTTKPADKDGVAEELVASFVGFEKGPDVTPGTRKPTTEWPVQGYMWSDYAIDPGDVVSYSVIPMLGPASALQQGAASAFTPPVKIGEKSPNGSNVFFNNGIIASQWVSRHLPDVDPAKSLQEAIITPGNKVRNYLAGELRENLIKILKDTNAEGGHIYLTLFELNDPELLPLVAAFGKRAHLVLGNGAVAKKGEDENAEARAMLKKAKCDVSDRMTAPRALAHNKFMVVCDRDNKPKGLWTGSTNWTTNGLCTQANNALYTTDTAKADIYLAQWKLLKTCGDLSPDTLKASNAQTRRVKDTSIWFTPMKEALDLKEANELIANAKEGVLFLMFNPGPRGSLLNTIIDLATAGSPTHRPDLYIQGVINQNPGTDKNPVDLFHRGAHSNTNADVVLPRAITEQLKYWQPELLKLPSMHAMVHSKVIVIDPFTDHPVVITGSHNFGPKASGTNDENLYIERNNPSLSGKYAAKIMEIYGVYRERSGRDGAKALKGLVDNDTWQMRPDSPKAAHHRRELDFWFGRRYVRNNERTATA